MKITQGVTRVVFVFKKVVIKIPNFTCQWDHFLHGLLANINESRTYKSSKILKTDHLLAPVLWSSWGGWLLIMKKVEVCCNDEVIDYTEWIERGHTDNKPSNFGYLDGRLVKIDYN